MLALKIIGVIALIVFLICMISVGADIGYENGEFMLSLKLCGVYLQLLPKDEKKRTEKKKKKPKEKKQPEDTEKKPEEENKKAKPKKSLKLDFTADEIISVLKKVFKGLGKLFAVKVDRFLLHYVAGGTDPYATAAKYGKLNAVLTGLAPITREKFKCKDVDVYTAIDFTLESSKIDFGIGFYIRIGQVFGAINTILFGALGVFIKNRLRLLKEKIIYRFSDDYKADKAAEEAEAAEAAKAAEKAEAAEAAKTEEPTKAKPDDSKNAAPDKTAKSGS